MSFNIPEDPFTRDLGLAIQSVGQNVGVGLEKRNIRQAQQQQNFNLAKSLGVSDQEAQQYSNLNPAQIPFAIKDARQRENVPKYAEYLFRSLGFLPDSDQAKALGSITDMDTLIQIGKIEEKNATEPRLKRAEIRKQLSDEETIYKNAMNDISNSLDDGSLSYKMTARAEKVKDNLRKEKISNQKNIKEGKPTSNSALESYADIFSETPGEFKDIKPEKVKTDKSGKMKFDSKNPDHIKMKNEILRQADGDRKAANKLLNEMFS